MIGYSPSLPLRSLLVARPPSFLQSLTCGLFLAALVQTAPAAAPAITSEPVDQTIFYGDPVTFNVGAAGTAPLSYQWFRNGSQLPSATQDSYTLPAVAEADNGAQFSVRVSNGSGSIDSRSATLRVDLGVPGQPQTVRLLQQNSTWKYNQTDSLDAVNWTAENYDDSAWPSGPGLLAFENHSQVTPLIGTTLSDPRTPPAGLVRGHAYYFRTEVAAPLSAHSIVPLAAALRVDDGAVIHFNGQRAASFLMDGREPLSDVYATEILGDATSDESITSFGAGLKPGTNVIAVSVHQANSGSSDVVWGMALDAAVYPRVRDSTAPTIVGLIPPPGTIPSLKSIEAHFSEAVKNVRASDLLVNGQPATNVVQFAPDVYVFAFPPPPTGTVQVAWSGSQAIIDASANSNRFAGGSFAYTLDPSAVTSSVRISEFMAGNTRILDDLGQFSDWIELQNAGGENVNVGGWFLTDDPARLTKWRIPAGATLPANGYQVIWASGNDRTNPAAPLHTSFKLDKAQGGFLALVYSDGTSIMSSFPLYPRQYDNISYGRDRIDPSFTGYFTNATPGAANATGGGAFGPEVVFSRLSGTFQQPFSLQLSCADPTAQIRYFLATDVATASMTNLPDATSPLYTGPIAINGSMQVRARAFPTRLNVLPGERTTETYIQIDSGAAVVQSSLPIVLFHNFGGGTPPVGYDQSAVMMVFGTGLGTASLANPPDLVTRIGINIRGRSTQGLPKSSYAVETWDEFNDDRDVEVLGMPAESDWVFYAPNSYDRPLIHNSFIHELSRQIGRYSSRVRMVEVFRSFGNGPVVYGPAAQTSYGGIYVLEEKIKRNSQRVDIAQLGPGDTNAVSITGGYMLKIDQQDSDERMLYAGGQAMVFVEPDMKDYQAYPGRARQENYARNYFDAFYNALLGPNWTDPVTGYRAYIDVPSWIDHHILNVLTLNADSLRLSGYFFKDRESKVEMGPLWDFDRSMGTSGDWRPYNPLSWMATNPLGGGDYGTDYFNPGNVYHNPWYSQLFYDPDFWQAWIDRWHDLRRAEFADTNLAAIVDFFAAQIIPAQPRESQRWADTRPRSGFIAAPDGTYSHTFPGTYPGEIDFMKRWLRDRTGYIDSSLVAPPTVTVGGNVSQGFVATVSLPAGEPSRQIYYTLNGTDPRASGGGVASGTLVATAPFNLTINANTRLVARHYDSSHSNQNGAGHPPVNSFWSGPAAATYVVNPPALALTELMFNPADNEELEFIELKNVGTAPISLLGVHFTQGIEFRFGASNQVTSLAPGQYVVLVRNQVAFTARYPSVNNIAGQYSGGLANEGERLALRGALEEPIFDFRFNDTWQAVADGLGFSLVPQDESAATSTYTNPAGWRASSRPGGSPGAADPAPVPVPGVWITEVLTHTDPPAVDAIELFNPTTNAADIGGWFLSDEADQPDKFRIPSNTVLQPGAYVTFTEEQFNPGAGGFALSSLGESVYLFSADATGLTGYRHGFAFGAQTNGATFGRFVSGDGREQFVTEKASTLGAQNLGPKIGPIIINEIRYAPAGTLDPNTLDEFIELRNISSQPVPLFDPAAPTNTWQLAGGVDFQFPEGVTVPPGSFLLLTGFDPVRQPDALSLFRSRYSLDSSVVVLGPWSGRLANEGESIQLLYPDKPEVAPSAIPGFVPMVLAEALDYSPLPPWPATGASNSLQRVAGFAFGNDPLHWQAAAPTPGRANPGSAETDTDGDGLPDAWELSYGLAPDDPTGDNGAGGDPDGDGMTNSGEYMAGTDPQNGADVLGFASVAVFEETCVLDFIARPGQVYTVERRDALGAASNWIPLMENLTGNGNMRVLDPAAGNERFYRLSSRRQ